MTVFLPGIYLITLVLGGYLIFSLLKAKQRRPDNLLLSGLLVSVMLSLWSGAVISLDIPAAMKIRITDYYVFASAYFWAPLLFLYIRKITGQLGSSWQNYAKHLSVPVLVSLSQIPIHFFGRFPNFGTMAMVFFFTFTFAYMAACHREINLHQARIRQSFSQIEELQLTWLKRLIWTFTVVLGVDLYLSVAIVSGLQEFDPMMGLVVLLECSAIFAVGYFALKQPQVLFTALEEAAITAKKKYDNSALDTHLARSLANDLTKMMKKDQPYKRNDLKLADLAELMGLSNHHLSQVINEQHGCNFYEYVNQYRIEYAAELMRSGEIENITKLAFDAGFNNRVSFTNAFKKKMGCTPSAYVKDSPLQAAG